MTASPHLLLAVSGHGYGHLAQCAPVINALWDRVPALRVTVCSQLERVVIAGRLDRHPEPDALKGKVLGQPIWRLLGGPTRDSVPAYASMLGYNVTDGAVHVHDLHATILHQLGIDHEQLTVRHNSIDRRLTDVHGHVLREMLA